MSAAVSDADLGLHVASVMTSMRAEFDLERSKIGRWLLWHDTHDEYDFAMRNKALVRIVPVAAA
jgi:hypothetical protein